MDISDDESIGSETPEEIIEKTKEMTLNSLPEKSRQKYYIQYNLFMEWCASKKVKKYSESVILAYLSELSEKYKSSTLWSIHSMLKATLLVKNDINIAEYKKVTSFLKQKSVGYTAKISKIFTTQEINKFLREAPDETFLMMKVVLIVGLAGACKSEELTNLTIDNLQDKGDILIIHIPVTKKNNKQRTFTICNNSDKKENAIDIISICRKYFSLRPKTMNSRRLFVRYVQGKCVAQNVGHHTIGSIPSKIAAYLNLDNYTNYTGHCFCRTSASLLVDTGADILSLKQHGDWKSISVTEGYVEESLNNKKILVAKEILNTNKNLVEEALRGPIDFHEIVTENTSDALLNSCVFQNSLSKQIGESNLTKQGASGMEEQEQKTSASTTSTFGKQGLVLHSQAREVIANVIDFMKNEAEHFRRYNKPLIPMTNFRERVLAATKISRKTYTSVTKEAKDVSLGVSTSFTSPRRKRTRTENCEPVKDEKDAIGRIVDEFCDVTVPMLDDDPDINIKNEYTQHEEKSNVDEHENIWIEEAVINEKNDETEELNFIKTEVEDSINGSYLNITTENIEHEEKTDTISDQWMKEEIKEETEIEEYNLLEVGM